MSATYKNPWHRRVGGPEYYESKAEPIEYRGHLIYLRTEFGYDIWDVVRDGVCITQLAALNGARKAIDKLHGPHPEEP